MKHLLNNMSEEEKNSIREQHNGGMKVMTKNFNKLINSKLGNSKPLVEREEIDYDEVESMMDHIKNNPEQSKVIKAYDGKKLFQIQGADEKVATYLLKNYLKLDGNSARFIAILDCQGVDLTGIDFCKYPNLKVVNLKGTPNNFVETQNSCYEEYGEDMYDFDF